MPKDVGWKVLTLQLLLEGGSLGYLDEIHSTHAQQFRLDLIKLLKILDQKIIELQEREARRVTRSGSTEEEPEDDRDE